MTTCPHRSCGRRLFQWIALAIAVLGLNLARAAVAPPAFTDEEVSAFGRQVADWINHGDPDVLVDHLDQFAFLDRVTNGLGLSAADERDFRAGMMTSFSRGLTAQFQQFESARFLRVETVQGEKRALIRLVPETDGVSYISFIPTRRAATAPMQWVDAFAYLSGESFATGSRRTAMAIIAGRPNGMARLTGTATGVAAHLREIQQMALALQAGDAKGAWAISERIPAEIRKDRSVLLLRLRAAQGVDDPTYLRVIGEWQAAFPNDPTLEFHSIDGAVLRKDYSGALRHIEAFGRQIGGDNYLDYLAANTLILLEKFPEARAKARAVLVAEPTLYAAYDVLLTISLKVKDHRETAALLAEFEGKLNGANMLAIVDEEPEYAEFKKSPEYKAWAATHVPTPPAKK